MTDIPDSSIRPENFVDCWSDDERMNFLFSAFPPNRSDNPHHWDTKMSFWTNLIADMATSSPCTFITWDNLFCKLTRNGKQPLGLNVVLEGLLESGELIPLSQYMQDVKSDETWVGWGMKWCVRKPVSWMANKVMSPIKSSHGRDFKRGKFILQTALKKKCDKLLSSVHEFMSSNKDDYYFLNILPYSKLCELAPDELCDQQSVDALLSTMCRNKVIELWNFENEAVLESNKHSHSSEKYIKFVRKSDKRVIPFSDVDIGIVRLCETRTRLHELINEAYQDIAKLTEKAKVHLHSQQRVLAKNALRKRKRLEASLENKEKCLANVEELLEKLHQCETDKVVMETYKSAIAAHNTLSEGMSPEDVSKTMDDVAQMFEIQSEVSEALSISTSSSDAEDMQELEDELAALMTSEKAGLKNGTCTASEDTNLKGHSELPDAPKHFPTVKSQPFSPSEEVMKPAALS